VRIDDDSVSKHHATLRFDQDSGDHSVVDEGSRNGTRVNGKALPPMRAAPIWAGAFLALGDAVHVFIDPPTLRRLSRLVTAS